MGARTGAIAVRRNQRDTDAQREYFATNGGVLEVSNNVLRVLVDEADHAYELNEAEVQKALERAQKMKAEAKADKKEAKAEAKADKKEAKAEKKEMNAEAKADKKEAKAEAKADAKK